MEIIDKTQIKKFVVFTLVIVIVLTVIPLAFYFGHFYDSQISDNTSDWGNIGSFFSGTIGTIFTVVAAFFSLISIYITLTIASKIQEASNNFNSENLVREKERFQKEIELTHKQNKPYPYLDVIKLNDLTKITLSNYGTGPMIVKTMFYLYESSEAYQHVMILFKAKVPDIKKTISIHYNLSTTLVIPANSSKVIAEITPTQEQSDEYVREQSELRNVLSKCLFCITYEDIFENCSDQNFSLKLLQD